MEKLQFLPSTSNAWCGDATPFSREKTLVALFEDAVNAHRSDVAVISRGVSLTYGELDRRSRILAQRLALLGITVDSKVGLLTKRSVHLITAMVAVVRPAVPTYQLIRDTPSNASSICWKLVTAMLFCPRKDQPTL